jgi:branched-chain amino acid transport system substrate-binding protein
MSSVMEPAGLDAGAGIISSAYVKDPLDRAWADDPGVKGWRDFMAKYVPDGDVRDSNYDGMVLEHVLKAAGNDLSRENIQRQALSIKDLELPMLLPGIKVNTGESDHLPVEQLQFMRFTGKQWERFGEVLSTK